MTTTASQTKIFMKLGNLCCGVSFSLFFFMSRRSLKWNCVLVLYTCHSCFIEWLSYITGMFVLLFDLAARNYDFTQN